MRLTRILLFACVLGLSFTMSGTPDTAQAKIWKTSTIVFKAYMEGIAQDEFNKCAKKNKKTKNYAKGTTLRNFRVYVHKDGTPRGKLVGRKTGKSYVKFKLHTGRMYYVRVEVSIPCGVMSGGLSFRVNNWHTQTVKVPVVNFRRR